MKKITKTKTSPKRIEKPEKKIVKIIKVYPKDEELVSIMKPLIPEPVKGDKGDPGKPGEPGTPGNDGAPGAPGAPGKSVSKAEIRKYIDSSIAKKMPKMVKQLEGPGSVTVEGADEGYNLVIDGTKHFVPNAVYGPKLRTFLQLGDGPGTYTGFGGKFVKVKVTEDGLEYGAGGEGIGDVVGPATNSADYIPQWDGADSKTLKNGIPTSAFEPAITDVTTNNVSNTKHGFFPKLPSVTDDKQYGIKNGAVAEITSGGTPGGSDTQVQFNDGGSFGGDAGFTYNKTTDTITLGTEDGEANIVGKSATSEDSTGGVVAILGGTGNTNGSGGEVGLIGGTGGVIGTGGGVILRGGTGGATSGNGGGIAIYGGSAQNGDGNGGDISFVLGAKSGSGTNGVIRFFNGTKFAILGLENIASTDKTFTFPNKSGTFAMTSDADMLLGTAQSVTETKTFTKDKLLVKGTSTGTTNLTTANTSATNYTATFPAKDGTVAMTSDITAGSSVLDMMRSFPCNNYYTMPIVGGARGSHTEATSANRMYGIPFPVGRTVTFVRIGMKVTGAASAGTKIRLGIYNDDGGGNPGSILIDAGTIDADSATYQEITISQELTKGTMYWLAALFEAETTVVACDLTAMVMPIYGEPGQPCSDFASGGHRIAQAYGALPSTFGTGTTGGNCPLIWMRTA